METLLSEPSNLSKCTSLCGPLYVLEGPNWGSEGRLKSIRWLEMDLDFNPSCAACWLRTG